MPSVQSCFLHDEEMPVRLRLRCGRGDAGPRPDHRPACIHSASYILPLLSMFFVFCFFLVSRLASIFYSWRSIGLTGESESEAFVVNRYLIKKNKDEKQVEKY